MKKLFFIAVAIFVATTFNSCRKETETIIERVEVQKGGYMHSGTEAPKAEMGNIGDYYLNRSTSELYGPKTAQGWGNPINLGGTKILSGEGAPKANQGANGDWYIDTENNRLYGPKTNNTWSTSYIDLGQSGEDEEEPDQPITPADYELSNDGKTLVKWKNKKTKKLNMQENEVLKKVTAIGNYAFEDMDNLIKVVLPNDLLTIGDRALAANIPSLESLENGVRIEIPNKVTHIGKGAFENKKLRSLTLPSSVISIGERAFKNNFLSSVVLSNGITTIPKKAFEGNSFSTVVIPNTVVTIEDQGFNLGELASVSLSNVQVIGEGAFRNNLLENLTIPATVKEIKESAFRDNRLTTITFEGTTPPFKNANGTKSIFEENRLQNIYVPVSSVETYKQALTDYASLIKAKP